MRLRTLFFSLFLSVASYAQTGNYFLSHFSPDQKQSDNVCFDIAQDERGVFYFATQAGVLQFDGRNWDIIRTNGAVYAIEFSENGDLYVAGSKGFGKITLDENGLESFIPIYDKADAGYVFQIAALDEKVYFLNDKSLFTYSIASDSVSRSSYEIAGTFSNLSEISGSLYVSTDESGIFKSEKERLVKSTLPLPDSNALIFSSKFENSYLLGTSDNRVFVYNENKRLKEIQLEDANYANASIIINATWVNKDLVALGTLRGGIIFVDPTTGKTAEIINYNTGLQDNEIYTLVCDRNKNVWAAHAYGFTRIAPFLPLRSFRYYPGLEGNLLCATTHRNDVYVGTSLGLYKLEKEEFYDEIIYYVDVPVKAKTKAKSNKTTTPPPPVKQEEPEKGGFFKFLKKKKTTPTQPTTTQAQQPVKTTKQKPKYKKEKRTKKILRSTYYGYKKVSGISAKVTQLIQWQGKLIAAGLDGAFEVNQLISVPIIEDPVRFLFASDQKKILIASTTDDKLHKVSFKKNTWVEENQIQNIDDPIDYIFEESNKAVWLCSFDKIYRLEYSGDTTLAARSMNIVNPNFDKTTGVCMNNEVVIATSNGFYFYDKNQKELVKADTLPSPKDFFSNGSTIWFRDEHQWFLTGNPAIKANIQLLNLFHDIRYISNDDGRGNVWIITSTNELYRFYSEKLRPIETAYPLFLKWIAQPDALRTRKSSLEIDQENSSIKVEVVKPDYIGSQAVEYRYFLQGLHTEWSEWSNSNYDIDFPYLPPGAYTLQFQSKDIFGKVTDMAPVKVEVLPPYWKRTWFYALEFGVFTCLVLLSFRLSHRFNLISRLLSLLSIIILIEFIQTAAGSTFTTNSGPVVDFLIQVCVAFVILPVEGFLRKFMLKSIEKTYTTTKK